MFIRAFEHLGERGITIPQTSGYTSAGEGASQIPHRYKEHFDPGMK